jgi:hypothetical protein
VSFASKLFSHTVTSTVALFRNNILDSDRPGLPLVPSEGVGTVVAMSRAGLGRMEMQQILPSAGNNHTLAATLPAEERRGARVPVRVPVNVAVGDDSPFPAITSNISRYGALILSSIPVPVGSIVWVQNARTSVWARVRVVWTATHPEMGPHHIGVELVNDGPHVWADERDRP